MYEATTNGIRIRVTPAFSSERSNSDDNYYFWTYTIEITNLGAETVQLQTRTWIITDANGRVENVHGKGVVGQTPTLDPGQSFTYTSGCPLRTPQGIMVGSYEMIRAGGGTFSVTVPAFSLDSPGLRFALN
jgi:ApaG protein